MLMKIMNGGGGGGGGGVNLILPHSGSQKRQKFASFYLIRAAKKAKLG